MGLPKLVPTLIDVPSQADPAGPAQRPLVDSAWTVLGEIGFALALVGGADLVLNWLPFAFGNPEWEFGTVTKSLDGLPALTVGLGLALGSGLAHGRRWRVRATAALFGALGLAIIAAAILYATTIPLALRSVTDPVVHQGLMKAIIKTTVQAVAYPAIFLWIAVEAWQRSGRRDAEV